MAKVGEGFDPAAYAPVAERVRLFYCAYPEGRIVTELVSRTADEVVFRALVFRRGEDAQPAATGWAAEREGDGEVNLVACLENTETSAIGRALANLGFTASRQRPSAEEMIRASRARARLARQAARGGDDRPFLAASDTPPAVPIRVVREERLIVPEDADAAPGSPVVADLLRLIARAERAGLRPLRAARWRAELLGGGHGAALLARCEQRLRAWVAVSARARR